MEYLLIPIFAITRYLDGKDSIPKLPALIIYALSTAALLPVGYIQAAFVGILIAAGFMPGWTSALQGSLDGVVQPGVEREWWLPFEVTNRLTGMAAMSWRWMLFFSPAFVVLVSPAFLALAAIGPIYGACGKWIKRDADGSGSRPNRFAEPLAGAWLATLLIIGV